MTFFEYIYIQKDVCCIRTYYNYTLDFTTRVPFPLDMHRAHDSNILLLDTVLFIFIKISLWPLVAEISFSCWKYATTLKTLFLHLAGL
jgi:hypothetical protein